MPTDAERILSANMLELATRYKVDAKFWGMKHELSLHVAADSDARILRCACGWEKKFDPVSVLTIRAACVVAALEEHVLSFTDPTHYTYYPQGV